MSKHTAEPWPEPDMVKFRWAPHGDDLTGGVLSAADFIRARVCVNYCAGMTAEQLTEDSAEIVREELTRLQTIRDELAAALEYYTTSTQDGKDDGMLARSTIERIFG